MNLFIENALTDPVYYASVVFVVMLSVVLHELGHAYAALWEGDTTARDAGHTDLNPLTHMGKTSLFFLFLVGIAWGQCPVNPKRFRHGLLGNALVSFAGPAVNLVLALIFSVAYAAWFAYSPGAGVGQAVGENVAIFLSVGAIMNVVLFLLNMIPIPPFDGYSVATSLSSTFRNNAGVIERNGLILFVLVFFLGGSYLFAAGRTVFSALSSTLLTLML